MLKKVGLTLAATMIVAAAALFAVAQADDKIADWDIPGGHFYTETAANNGQVTSGYSVTDDGGIPMWTEFTRLGGVYALGYPVSGRFVLNGKVVQLTQKVGLVWQSDISQAKFLNVFSLLHAANKDAWLVASKGIPAEMNDPNEAGKSWNDVSQMRYKLLDVHPDVKGAYFGAYDPVNTYGLPASNWLETPRESTMRFSNVVIQQWKQVLPWAGPGQVSIANGGDILKESSILGPLPFTLQPAPAPIQAIPAGFAVASFYADFFVGRRTSDGRMFSQDALTCATNAFPLGTKLRLSTPDGKHSIVVVNADRPASWNTRIDLSKAAFQALYPLGTGVGTVKVEVVR